MSEYAYWISPKCKIIKPKSRHILAVVRNPECFGETDKSIQQTFAKYNEPIHSNIEGKAREEILLRVIRRGNIRIRLGGTRRNQRWSIQLNKLTPKVNDYLWTWANQVINDGTAPDKYADVVIHQIGKNDKMTKTSLFDIASGSSIKENKEFVLVKVYTEKELIEFPRWIDYANEIDSDMISEQAKIEILAYRMRG